MLTEKADKVCKDTSHALSVDLQLIPSDRRYMQIPQDQNQLSKKVIYSHDNNSIKQDSCFTGV